MPRVLKGRKKRIFAAACLIILFVVLVFYRMYGIIALLLLCYYANSRILQHIWRPRAWFSAKRKIGTVDTLVVGDLCSKRILARHCNLRHSIIVTAPNRQLKSTAVVLNHLESILSNQGTVVVVAPKRLTDEFLTLFDVPYIGLVTALENNVDRKSPINALPLLRHPLKCLRYIGGGY